MTFQISRKLVPNAKVQNFPNLDIGKQSHTFFEKAAWKELALQRTYGDFYQTLATYLNSLSNSLSNTRLVLEETNIAITANSPPTPSSHNTYDLRTTLAKPDLTTLAELLKFLIPWRKGPYSVYGISIMSEWQSHLKWHRIKAQLLPECTGKCIVDVGANNGYFMFRLATAGAEWVIGLEPTLRYVVQYDLLRACLLHKNGADALAKHYLVLLGYEDLALLGGRVDIILLLGILYHHPNPLFILSLVYAALRKTGKVLIDCEGIEQPESVALVPERTYTGKRGFWFLPTRSALIAWLRRTGFRNIEVFYAEKLTSAEQHQSVWAPSASLAEGLKTTPPSENHICTLEGYPPPVRYYISAYKS